ncbi:MAG TPA: type II toxin-antitoxin system VapB family antitoxin [Spirochaetales bacterium]|nr:type II toxin-antitoxin system VapB family antitoxin [Spirochaetales bacterium]
MVRMTLTLDENLVEEAQQMFGASTKRETIQIALIEVVKQRKREIALTHCGKIKLDLSQEQLQSLREQG